MQHSCSRDEMPEEPFGRRTISRLQQQDRWGNPLALWVLAAILFTVPAIGIYLSRLQLDNTIEQWLPAHDPQKQVVEWFDREFGRTETVLVSWKGSSWDDPRAAMFAERLRKRPGQETGVVSVTSPYDLFQQMTDHGVDEAEARQRIAGVLSGDSAAGAVGLLLQIDEQLVPRERIIEWIESAAETCRIPVPDLHLAGGMVIRKALDESVRDNSWNPEISSGMAPRLSPTVISCLISMVLAFVLLRSVRLALMVLAVSVYTAGLTLALIPLTGGTMNMVLVVLAPLLIVLTLSGSIHLANYWKHAAIEDPLTAVAAAVRVAAKPCFLAVATTAVGMLSLLTSNLEPVRSFGWLSAVGVGLSLGLILVGLPALLVLWPPRTIRLTTTDHSLWKKVGAWLAHHHRIVGWSCTAAVLMTGAGLMYFRTETKLIRFFPTDSEIVGDYQFLEENICGLVPVEVVVAFGEDSLERLNALERMALVYDLQKKLEAYPEVSGAISLASFRDSIAAPGPDAPARSKIRYRKAAVVLENRLHEAHSDLHGLVHLAGNPLEADVGGRRISIPSGSEVWRINACASTLTETDYGQITRDIQALADETAQQHRDVLAVVTGTVPLFLRTQEAVLESLIKSLGLAFVIIEVIMMLLLRGVRAGTLAMLPNIYPVVVVFGCVAWCGVPIDIGSMVTASVALGIAIDGTVHLLTWFENGLRSGLSRNEAVAAALAHCGPAMSHTTAIICCGLLALLTADLLLISRFGWLMAALVFAALVGDVIFLPTLLSGPLGKLMESRIHRTNFNDEMRTRDSAINPPPVAPHDDHWATSSKSSSAVHFRTRSTSPSSGCG